MRPPDIRSAPIRRLPAAVAVSAALLLGGCNAASPAGTSAPTLPSASRVSAQPGSPSAFPSGSALAGQTDSDWGRIWDRLPAAFPIYPGAAPADEAQTGPVSAIFAVEGQDAQAIAAWIQAEVEHDGYRTESLNGPLEDGSFVLESVGEAGCRVEVAVAPLGGLTTMTVRYGAACPSP
jgi:hypothetical protein